MEYIKCTHLQSGKTKLYAASIVRNPVMRNKMGLVVSDPDYDQQGNKTEAHFNAPADPVLPNGGVSPPLSFEPNTSDAQSDIFPETEVAPEPIKANTGSKRGPKPKNK